jgi:hypothetical protein
MLAKEIIKDKKAYIDKLVIPLTDEDFEYILTYLKNSENSKEYPFYIWIFEGSKYWQEFMENFINYLISTQEYKKFVKQAVERYASIVFCDKHTLKQELEQEICLTIFLHAYKYKPTVGINNYLMSFLYYIDKWVRSDVKRRLLSNESRIYIPIPVIEKIQALKYRMKQKLLKSNKDFSEDSVNAAVMEYLKKEENLSDDELYHYKNIVYGDLQNVVSITENRE